MQEMLKSPKTRRWNRNQLLLYNKDLFQINSNRSVLYFIYFSSLTNFSAESYETTNFFTKCGIIHQLKTNLHPLLIYTPTFSRIIIIIINIKGWAIWPVPSPELQLLSPFLRSHAIHIKYIIFLMSNM
jgi:hypothetical protein